MLTAANLMKHMGMFSLEWNFLPKLFYGQLFFYDLIFVSILLNELFY